MKESGGSFLGALMKFYSSRKHAEQFMDGVLYCNRVSYFRELEDRDRGDADEGMIVHAGDQVGELFIVDEEAGKLHRIPGVTKTRFRYNSTDRLALFCTALVRSDRYEIERPEMAHQFMERLHASHQAFVRMGAHTVVVLDVERFLNQVKAATEGKGFVSHARAVEYYDAFPRKVELHGDQTFDPVFCKHESYRDQREHRIAIDTRDDGLEPLRLDIGSLRDITVYAETTSLIENIRFRREAIPAN